MDVKPLNAEETKQVSMSVLCGLYARRALPQPLWWNKKESSARSLAHNMCAIMVRDMLVAPGPAKGNNIEAISNKDQRGRALSTISQGVVPCAHAQNFHFV